MAPGRLGIAAAGLGAGKLRLQEGHGAVAPAGLAFGHHRPEPRDGGVEVVPVQAHLGAGPLSDAAHLGRGGRGAAGLARAQ
ncbi:hypothetical protein [Variovorax sp. dw_954]|uniref:hypothetical protein n=1 Tax=Variovorax sp. dw_954 TaxID=2720078 RepID=UPI0021172137|nr:hypothetical protein [Variovorax sp. dw_954]